MIGLDSGVFVDDKNEILLDLKNDLQSVRAKLEEHDKSFEEQRGETSRLGMLMVEQREETSRLVIQMAEQREETSRLGILMEDQNTTIHAMFELIRHIDSRLSRQDVLEDRLDDHEQRISAIESSR
jgi:5,10-methylene-tetrahydrofolate dehydrogenase/methenyl tetrahydrofolate cyclohydrolase